MALTKINSGQVRFQDPTSVVFIPWSEGAPGTDGYDIHDIVGDTFSLTQDDADRTEIPWEFGDDPLDENISLGNRNLTMQCLDYQDDIMATLFGWDTDTDGFSVAPSQYSELFCTIVLRFGGIGKNIVMPKVKMDSKTAFENLRTDIARGELGGVLYATPVKLGTATSLTETGIFFAEDGKAFTVGATQSGSTISGGTVVTLTADGDITIAAAS
jgi:hypothetical protein